MDYLYKQLIRLGVEPDLSYEDCDDQPELVFWLLDHDKREHQIEFPNLSQWERDQLVEFLIQLKEKRLQAGVDDCIFENNRAGGI